jgi:hypothetical protein
VIGLTNPILQSRLRVWSEESLKQTLLNFASHLILTKSGMNETVALRRNYDGLVTDLCLSSQLRLY